METDRETSTLALELLIPCVMIWGSEKRRLVGKETAIVWRAEQSFTFQRHSARTSSCSRFFQNGTSKKPASTAAHSVLPLLNPFYTRCVFN
jgi:hypothetical protein